MDAQPTRDLPAVPAIPAAISPAVADNGKIRLGGGFRLPAPAQQR